VIEVLTWVVVVLLVAGYVAFFAARYRKEQAAKRAAEPPGLTRPSSAMPTSPPLEPLHQVDAPRRPATGTGAPPERPPERPSDRATGSAPEPPATGVAGVEVADLIRGIRLPDELVPRPDVMPRTGVHDRVVFVTTDAPADVVRERLTSALQDIGADVRWDRDGWLALLSRDGRAGWLQIHPSPAGIVPPGTVLAPTVPIHTVCAEFWTDTT
jgi:hypothetical protein